MAKNLNFAKAAIAFALSVAGIGAAQACDLTKGGFLAALGKCAVPEAAPVLDRIDDFHGAIGSPLDRVWNDTLRQRGIPTDFNRGMPQLPVPQMRLGNVCVTPFGSFPGPFNPVGMPCMTPVGPGTVR